MIGRARWSTILISEAIFFNDDVTKAISKKELMVFRLTFASIGPTKTLGTRNIHFQMVRIRFHG